MFYSNNQEPHNVHTKKFGADVFSYTVDVLAGVPYQFHVRAVTIKPGSNATETLTTKEYGRFRAKKCHVNAFKLKGN